MKKKNIIELTRFSADEYRRMEKLPYAVLLDSVRSMMNVGSIFRTADAFRAEEVILCGITGVPPHREIHKTALGAEDSVKWTYHKDALETLLDMQKDGWKVCVLEQVHHSIPLDEFSPAEDERYVLVVGNEVEGVDQRIVDIADYVLEIPQEGVKHSLNVAVSGGIAIYHLYSSLKSLHGS